MIDEIRRLLNNAPVNLGNLPGNASVNDVVVLDPATIDTWWPQFSRWPPDVFALTSVLLANSGAYRCVVSPPSGEVWPPPGWPEQVRHYAAHWRRYAVKEENDPPELLNELLKCLQQNTPLDELATKGCWDACKTILTAHAVADDACAGFGVPRPPPGAENDEVERNNEETVLDAYYLHANNLLIDGGTLSRLPTRAIRVLPKFRTPQRGMSLRSLSHHLAVDQSEVAVNWFNVGQALCTDDRLNLLVVPWPFEIKPNAFGASEQAPIEMDEGFGFFKFEPTQDDDCTVAAAVGEALKQARGRSGEVHGIILPELAVTETELKRIVKELNTQSTEDAPPLFLLAGVRGERQNCAKLVIPPQAPPSMDETLPQGEMFECIQHKHHRWCLDARQIQQYHLGAALHPRQLWWEDTELRGRCLNFVASEGFTLCHLICEDLAQQDPVAQTIRAVGPTLVIALLLDGPQLAARWPGRYASVLADDPGSSVLTVSPLGMTLRSRPAGCPPSRTVGLWNDSRSGPRELTLDGDAHALLLTLSREETKESTADGRVDETAKHLVLSAVEQISWERRERRWNRWNWRGPRKKT